MLASRPHESVAIAYANTFTRVPANFTWAQARRPGCSYATGLPARRSQALAGSLADYWSHFCDAMTMFIALLHGSNDDPGLRMPWQRRCSLHLKCTWQRIPVYSGIYDTAISSYKQQVKILFKFIPQLYVLPLILTRE